MIVGHTPMRYTVTMSKNAKGIMLMAGLLIAGFFTCVTQVRAQQAGTVYSLSSANVSYNSVTLIAQYEPTVEPVTAYFEYKIEGASSYSRTESISGDNVEFEFRKGISGLTPDKAYVFHVMVNTANGLVRYPASPSESTFTTLALPVQEQPNNPGENQGNQGNQANTISDSDKLQNPLAGVDTIPQFIAKIIDIVVKIATPILVLFFIYTGFLFIKAQGSEEGLKHAKDTLLYGVIGAAIILGAWVLAEAIQGTIEQLR